MSRPREPRDPYGRDAAGRDPPDDEGGTTWGRPPAGGWGAAEPDGRYERTGHDRDEYDRGEYDRGEYDRGEYDRRKYDRGASGRARPADAEYDWPQPEYAPSHRPGRATAGYERGDPSWGQGHPTTPRRAARRGRGAPWVVLAAAGVVVVACRVLGFVTPGWFVTRVFDTAAVQNGVAKVLTDDYAAEGVADVHCPERVGVVAGAAFTCDATIDGDRRPGRLRGRTADLSGHPVRALGADELHAAHDLFAASLLLRPSADEVWERRRGSYAPGRTFGVVDPPPDGRLAAMASSYPSRTSVPGGADSVELCWANPYEKKCGPANAASIISPNVTRPPMASGLRTNRRAASWSWLRDRTVNSRSTGAGATSVVMALTVAHRWDHTADVYRSVIGTTPRSILDR